MTYRDLLGLLEHLRYNIEKGNIKPEVRVLKLCLDCGSSNSDNILFWRFSQVAESLSYPELITLFQMRELISQNEDIYYSFISKVVNDVFYNDSERDNQFKKLSNNQETHALLQKKIADLSLLLRMNQKEYYAEIRKNVGDAIFEEIRYELNPRHGDLIDKLYDLMQDEVGNLIDKGLFVSATKFENPDEMRLLINIILLTKHYGLTPELLEEISSNAKIGQFRNLFVLYERLLCRNPNIAPVNENLFVVENQDKALYNLNWIRETEQLISGLINPADYSRLSSEQRKQYAYFDDINLFVLINGKLKFKNRNDDTQHSAEDIQRQLVLSWKRVENFGKLFEQER